MQEWMKDSSYYYTVNSYGPPSSILLAKYVKAAFIIEERSYYIYNCICVICVSVWTIGSSGRKMPIKFIIIINE